MFLFFLIWALIIGATLVFSSQSEVLWQRLFAAEIREIVRAAIFYISLIALVLLGFGTFYFFSPMNVFLLVGIVLLWCLLLKLILQAIVKS